MNKYVTIVCGLLFVILTAALLHPGAAEAALRGASQSSKALITYINGKMVVIDDGVRVILRASPITPVYSMLPTKIKIDNASIPTARNPGTNDYRIGDGLNALPRASSGLPGPHCEDNGQGGIRPCSHNDEGDARFVCQFAHFAYDDPIVYPGQPNKSHLHAFFGNTETDYLTTAGNIRSRGGSTCPGGAYNKTGYWVPALVNKRTGKVKIPTGNNAYYKSGYDSPEQSALIVAMPVGLRIIACSPTELDGTPTKNPCGTSVWDCSPSGTGHTLPDGSQRHTIPSKADCPQIVGVGGDINNLIVFPRCWDGVNLDSPDHTSHMAQAANGGTGPCPPDHPVRFPVISYNIHYQIDATDDIDEWYLSSDDPNGARGATAHADWFMGWDRVGTAATGYEDILDTLVKTCIANFTDCHDYDIGPFKAGATGSTQWRTLQ